MGKVISLKLNKREKRIVSKLNQEGITNSYLIRTALWHYFKSVSKDTDNVNYLEKTAEPKDDKDKDFFYETLYNLNKEVKLLREENNRIKEEFSEEINNLREQIDDNTNLMYSKRKEPVNQEKYSFDIRKNIDEILSNKRM